MISCALFSACASVKAAPKNVHPQYPACFRDKACHASVAAGNTDNCNCTAADLAILALRYETAVNVCR